jgi:hypothetical protein
LARTVARLRSSRLEAFLYLRTSSPGNHRSARAVRWSVASEPRHHRPCRACGPCRGSSSSRKWYHRTCWANPSRPGDVSGHQKTSFLGHRPPGLWRLAELKAEAVGCAFPSGWDRIPARVGRSGIPPGLRTVRDAHRARAGESSRANGGGARGKNRVALCRVRRR